MQKESILKMSDSGDDWEKQLEDEDELEKQVKKAEEDKKKLIAFKGEDEYDSDEERKKQDAAKKVAALALDSKKKMAAGGAKDYDRMFEERLNSTKPKGSVSQQRIDEIRQRSDLSEEAKAQQLQIAAEMDITESLFADLNVDANSLNLEKDYVNFGKKVSSVLYEGKAPYRIPVFFKELLRDLSKNAEAKNIKEILDSMTTLYNEKVKDEKDKEKGGKGGAKAKVQLKAGKQSLNQQLVTNLMGDDGYGDEDDDEDGGQKRAQEAEYDFM